MVQLKDTWNGLYYSQVQRGISIDINNMWLNFAITLEQELHYIMVSKARTEMEWDMVFIVLGIHCHQQEKKRRLSGVLGVSGFSCVVSRTFLSA